MKTTIRIENLHLTVTGETTPVRRKPRSYQVGQRVNYRKPGRRYPIYCEIVSINRSGNSATIHVREVNSGKSHYVTADALSAAA